MWDVRGHFVLLVGRYDGCTDLRGETLRHA
jgi:hypothetical protein